MFFFLFLLSDLLYFFFHFTVFSVYINTIDELNRLTNVGNLWEIRTRTQKIKLSKRDKWLLKKGKSDFLEKIPSLKRLCFTYLATDLRGTINTKNLNGEWIFFFIHINEARNWPSALVKSKIARKRNPNRFLEGFMKIRELLVSDFSSHSVICDCDFNKELGQVALLNKNQLS